MFFILRMVFWLAVVALLLPAPRDRHDQQASAGLSTTMLADKAVSAALSFCATNPQHCAAGLAGARRIGDLLSGQTQEAPAAASVSPIQQLTALPPPRPAIP
ncbi:hypothetical protein [Labrys neptuniae]